MVLKRTQIATKVVTRTRKLAAREEQVIRMSKGISVPGNERLEAKTDKPELLAQLKDIEASLFIQAGRMPGLSTKSRIIDRLKKQS